MRRIRLRFTICSSETGEVLSETNIKAIAIIRAFRLALRHGGAYVLDGTKPRNGSAVFEVLCSKHFDEVYGYDVR